MKVIKSVLIALSIIVSACNNSNPGQTEKNVNEQTDNNPSAQTANPKSASGEKKRSSSDSWEKLVMKQFRDSRGVVFVEMPFPSSWKLMNNAGNGAPTFTGPNGLKVTDFPAQSFMYTNDPGMQQIYYQSGQPLRPMPGIEQIIQQDLVPWCGQYGFKLVRSYEIPEVSRVDKWYNDQLYKTVPTQTEIAAIGTEWKAENGTPYFLLMHLSSSVTAELHLWNYWCTGLEAEPAYFEAAKKQLIFGLANANYPLEPILAYNEREAQKANQSWAAHNQRMAQNKANFEASQRAHVNNSNAINEAIMSGWRERNASSDRQQEQFIDVINERTNVVDPSTGQQYKVSSGSNQYWMNNNGEYFGTDLHDYNPNLDENMNRENWQQLQELK